MRLIQRTMWRGFLEGTWIALTVFLCYRAFVQDALPGDPNRRLAFGAVGVISAGYRLLMTILVALLTGDLFARHTTSREESPRLFWLYMAVTFIALGPLIVAVVRYDLHRYFAPLLLGGRW